MRFVAIIREVALNLVLGTSRAITFASIMVVAIGLLGAAEAVQTISIERQAAQFRAGGGSTLVYAAPGRIDGAACDALRSIPGVTAAGAIRQSLSQVALSMPSTQIPTFEVSPTFGGFTSLGDPPINRGPLASADLAKRLGLHSGSLLRLQSGSTRVAGTYQYPSDGRAAGYGYALFLPAATTSPFDQCWVETWPQSAVVENLLTGVLLRPTALTAQAAPPQLTQLNGAFGAKFDGVALFGDRITRFAAIVAFFLALGLGVVSVAIRRLELASARHAGVRIRDQAVQISLETIAWDLAAAIVALAAILILVSWSSAPDPSSAAWAGARVVAFAFPGPLIGAAIATLFTQERQLFAYFKDR